MRSLWKVELEDGIAHLREARNDFVQAARHWWADQWRWEFPRYLTTGDSFKVRLNHAMKAHIDAHREHLNQQLYRPWKD